MKRPMITITPEHFQRALDAIGAVPLEVAYPKEYSEAIARMSKEMADEIDAEIIKEILAIARQDGNSGELAEYIDKMFENPPQ